MGDMDSAGLAQEEPCALRTEIVDTAVHTMSVVEQVGPCLSRLVLSLLVYSYFWVVLPFEVSRLVELRVQSPLQA